MDMEWLQADVTLSDMTMHYIRTGGDKPALVLAHGFTDNGLCWLPVVQVLARDYDVILPDARGHGLSSRIQAGQSVDRGGDLAEFIQALKLDRPVVGGHSMGGTTASVLGAHFPDLSRALILEDPAWFDLQPARPPMSSDDNPWMNELRGYASQTVEDVMAKGRANNSLWPEIEMRPWAESKKQVDLNCFKAVDVSRERDWKEIVRALRVPTLLITGEVSKGAIISVEQAQKATEINPLIQVAHIPGVGHSIRREGFSGFMAAVSEFLQKL
jgi:N-formylmaleamate deformylase